MSIDSRQAFATLTGYAASSGFFDSVNGHEPKSAPGTGVSASFWINDLRPIQSSGLAAVSMRLEFACRIALNMLTEPQDDIDPAVMDAVDAMLGALIGDFDFGGQGRYIDVLGSDGEPLRAQPGYVNQDSKMFRVMVILIPILINDAYTEVA
jgi:hypothetical protein